MDSIDYLDALRRRWPILVVAALIGALTAFFGTTAKPTLVQSSYNAVNTLVVSQDTSNVGQSSNQVSITQIPLFVQQGAVPEAVRTDLGYSATVTATVDQQTNTVQLLATATTAKSAQDVADAYADQLVKYLAQKQDSLRTSRIDSINKRLAALQASAAAFDKQLIASPNDDIIKAQKDAAIRAYSTTYEQLQDLNLQDSGTINLTTLGPSQAVKITTGGFQTPQTRQSRVPIAAAVGLLLGLALAFLMERFDGRIRDRRRAEQAFGAPVIAELPTLPRNRRRALLIVGPDRQDHFAEAYRTMRTSVTFLASAGDVNAGPLSALGVILITSASPAEGKTTTAANLAAAFAETGRSVIVVNADFRRPRISEFFTAIRPRPAIAFGSIDDVAPEALLVDSSVKGVRILDLSTLGAPAGALARATRRLVEVLRDRVDVIIIDSPPLLVSAEALEFITVANVAILSARIGRSRIDGAKRAGELVHFGGVEKVAIVLNESKSQAGRQGRYYRYYGADVSPRQKAKRNKGAVPPGQGVIDVRATDQDRTDAGVIDLDAFDLGRAKTAATNVAARSDAGAEAGMDAGMDAGPINAVASVRQVNGDAHAPVGSERAEDPEGSEHPGAFSRRPRRSLRAARLGQAGAPPLSALARDDQHDNDRVALSVEADLEGP